MVGLSRECHIEGRKEPVAIHYDGSRVMNVQGHGSMNLVRAVRSFLHAQ